MVKYNEEAMVFANIIKDKNRLKAQIAGSSDTIQIIKSFTANIKVTDYNLVVKTRPIDTDGFYLSHTTYGILGTATLGATLESQSEVVRRKWEWNSIMEFDEGEYSDNIDIQNADIRLAR